VAVAIDAVARVTGLSDREEGFWVALAIDAVATVREGVALVIELIAGGIEAVAGRRALEAKSLLTVKRPAKRRSTAMRPALRLSGIPVFLLSCNRKGCRNRQPFSFFIL